MSWPPSPRGPEAPLRRFSETELLIAARLSLRSGPHGAWVGLIVSKMRRAKTQRPWRAQLGCYVPFVDFRSSGTIVTDECQRHVRRVAPLIRFEQMTMWRLRRETLGPPAPGQETPRLASVVAYVLSAATDCGSRAAGKRPAIG